MQATVYNIKGAEVTTVELDDNIFGIEPNAAVMHQALVRQHANARQGTASTKTRQEVRGGGKKPYRQKGTGNARQGSRRAPQYTGGAVIFGPRPRSYEKDMPRKMRRLAVRSALSVKVIEDNLLFIDGFEGLEPRTKSMAEALTALKLNDQKVLILVAERDETVYRAAGNLANVKTLVAGYLNLDDMFKYTKVIVPLGALDVINRILGSSTAAEQE
ncbi:MAG: 50S ribosomal protein L4 [Chloroflexi bacterium]|uniref:Large ribosomal subunit protein uL4 n=1 Tax=Candidatus Chlorohelix allophototropha TaxID=3003348 RepID=A0A8T7LYX0_9CHLR|nr:50S ribosomal protein L4 [Chloroflexota bacterium]WJW65629.1 50S ribosomal protein L4 [Chloroflexota bacterium L227-S17]